MKRHEHGDKSVGDFRGFRLDREEDIGLEAGLMAMGQDGRNAQPAFSPELHDRLIREIDNTAIPEVEKCLQQGFRGEAFVNARPLATSDRRSLVVGLRLAAAAAMAAVFLVIAFDQRADQRTSASGEQASESTRAHQSLLADSESRPTQTVDDSRAQRSTAADHEVITSAIGYMLDLGRPAPGRGTKSSSQANTASPDDAWLHARLQGETLALVVDSRRIEQVAAALFSGERP